MSILKHIETDKCPECGCDVVVMERIRTRDRPDGTRVVDTYTNGSRWEYREFLCGHTAHYLPNYMGSVEGTGDCRASPEANKRRKRLSTLRSIIETVDCVDVDEGFRESMQEALGSVRLDDAGKETDR